MKSEWVGCKWLNRKLKIAEVSHGVQQTSILWAANIPTGKLAIE